MIKKVKFNVLGMTCSSCSAHVEKAVSKVSGVKSVNVNLLSNNMIVEYDENTTNNESIISAVIEAGYDASVSDNETKKEDVSKVNNIDEKKIYYLNLFPYTSYVCINASYVVYAF